MSQSVKIEKFLKSGKKLSAAQAKSQYGVQNLSARISDLRKAGMSIRTLTTKAGTTAYAL